jgi:hypothetical protein
MLETGFLNRIILAPLLVLDVLSKISSLRHSLSDNVTPSTSALIYPYQPRPRPPSRHPPQNRDSPHSNCNPAPSPHNGCSLTQCVASCLDVFRLLISRVSSPTGRSCATSLAAKLTFSSPRYVALRHSFLDVAARRHARCVPLASLHINILRPGRF